MCGIMGIVDNSEVARGLLDGLRRRSAETNADPNHVVRLATPMTPYATRTCHWQEDD